MTARIKPWHIFAAALALRLGAVFALPVPPVRGDALEYEAIAANVAESGCYCLKPGEPTACRPPGYPMFLGGIYSVFGHEPRAARAAQALLGAAVCPLIFYSFLPLFGRRPAMLGASLCAAHPVLIAYSGYLLTETLCAFLLCACLFFYSRWQASSAMADLAPAGVFFALGTMTRPDLLLLPFFLFGAEAVLSKRPLPSLRGLAVFFSLLAALVLPWTMRNRARLGEPVLFVSGKGQEFLFVMLRGGPTPGNLSDYRALISGANGSIEAGKILDAEIGRMLREEPVRTALNVASSARFIPAFWITSHSSVFGIDRPNSEYRKEGRWGMLVMKTLLLLQQIVMLAAAAAGMYMARYRLRPVLPFILLSLYFTLHMTIVPRYHVPLIPFLLAFAGLAAARLTTEEA